MPKPYGERKQSRERPSSWQEQRPKTSEPSGDGNRAENIRALDGSRGREHRAFRRRIRRQRMPVPSGNKEPRTLVLFTNSESRDQDSCSREHPYYQLDRIGFGPDCSALGRFILAARLRSSGRAPSSNAWRGARGVRLKR